MININNLENQALRADRRAYAMADDDFAKRYPGLVSARKKTMQDALESLTGPLDPTVQNTFAKSALAKSFGSYGAAGGTGSAAAGGSAASVALDVIGKQDSDRSWVNRLSDENAPRTYGLSPQNGVDIMIANNQAMNTQRWNEYLAKMGEHNAKKAQQEQTIAALGSMGGGGGGGKGGKGGAGGGMMGM